LGKEVNLNPPLTLGQLPDTPEELLKLDQVFIKSELKVGVIYVKEVSRFCLSYHHEQTLHNFAFPYPLFIIPMCLRNEQRTTTGSIYGRTNFRQ